jgi:predicted transcriptional regulator
MKISDPLDKILDNETKIKILRFLVRTNAQWNGRQIAKEIGVTPATAHKALHGLHKGGVVILQNVGRTHIYNLNDNNYLVANLLLHKDRPTSDIDLAVIVRDKEVKKEAENLFEKIDKRVSLEFGNTISPYINTEAEFMTKHKKGLGVI